MVMFKQLLFIILTFTFFFSLNSTLEKNLKKSNNLRIILPDKYISLLSNGYKDILSSILWIDLIQNSSTTKDHDPFEINRSINISELSPYFHFNYKYNGLMLSVAKDQFLNANKLLNNGLKYFIDDFDFLFQIGFNNLFLIKNTARGLYYFKHIYEKKIYAKHNKYFPLMYSKAIKRYGNVETAREILLQNYIKLKDPRLLNILESWK